MSKLVFSINGTPTKPIYKDDLTLDLELESSQRFYRKKLSGKLVFVREDFDFINGAPFETEFVLTINSVENGTTTEVYRGKFMKTDCAINYDDRKITVQPDVLDQYNDILAGIEKEFDLIKLAPEIQRLQITKRPLTQIYVPGDTVVSCFLSGMAWEMDSEQITDTGALTSKYKFTATKELREINVTGTNSPNVNGLYLGEYGLDKKYTSRNGYYIICIWEAGVSPEGVLIVLYNFQIKRSSDDVTVFGTELGFSFPGQPFYDPANAEMTYKPVGSGSSGTAVADAKATNIYARFLCDVDKIDDLNTYPIPDDDIVENNKNYRRVIGLQTDSITFSQTFSDEPTEWGLADNGKYFQQPHILDIQQYFPIARSTWRYASVWYYLQGHEWLLEEKARKDYLLRDNYPVSSIIKVLLAKVAPGITHEATPEYSQFLYADSNPISGLNFQLLVTQKTNILNGDYQQPTQAAPATLQQFTNMLRDVFKCYWYIEDNKFKIEHVEFFRRGGSYEYSPVISLDLTELQNVRNGKKWSFGTNEVSFDKVDLAQRYEFEWMDEATLLFKGQPVEVVSKYVTEGKIEEINVSNFTSDIDLVLLDPSNISNDGFMLFAAVKNNLMTLPEYGGQYIDQVGTYGSIEEPLIELSNAASGTAVVKVLSTTNMPDNLGAIAKWYDIDRNPISGDVFIADGTLKYIELPIPENAAYFAIGGVVDNQTVNSRVYEVVLKDVPKVPIIRFDVMGMGEFRLQNGLLSFHYLQLYYWLYDMPAQWLEIGKQGEYARSIERKKKQVLTFPAYLTIDPIKLIKTDIGNGQIEKMSVNLCSLTAKTTLKYDTE